MQIPPFTIVYRSPQEGARAAGHAPGDADQERLSGQLRLIGPVSHKGARSLRGLNPPLGHTLIPSACQLSSARLNAGLADVRRVVKELRPVVEDLTRAPEVVSVAVWDLDAHVGGLPGVIAALNRAQTAFTFLYLQAPLPAGLVTRGRFFPDWAKSRHKKNWALGEEDLKDFDDNLMSND